MGNCLSTKEKTIQSKRAKGAMSLKSKQKQGARELKQNYQIDNNTVVLGSGAFGKVFLTFNKHNQDH